MAIGDRIRTIRKQNGWSQSRLADTINQAQTTISSWERNRTEPTREDVSRIAKIFNVSVADLEISANLSAPLAKVPLVGFVGASSMANFYADGDQLGEVDAPENAGPDTVGAEIRGESLGPLFDGWILYFDDVRRPVTEDLIGRLCVVGLPDGRVLVKKLQASKTQNVFHLLSNNEAPILDQTVSWAARVTAMMPR